MNPVQALRTDLRSCGASIRAMERTCNAYAHALIQRSSERWETFYRELFAALRDAPDPITSRAALQSLLLILEDDLGVQLFEIAALRELRGKLGISTLCDGQSFWDVFVTR